MSCQVKSEQRDVKKIVTKINIVLYVDWMSLSMLLIKGYQAIENVQLKCQVVKWVGIKQHSRWEVT